MLTARPPALLHAVGDLWVASEPDVDEPPPGWSLLAVTSVGICGSDLHWFTDGGIGENRIEHPVVPGHEFAAVAVTGLHAGRRVAFDPAIPRGSCETCGLGHRNLRPTVRFAGHGALDGALRQQLVWPDDLLHPLPDDHSDDAGALLEPLGVAIHAVWQGPTLRSQLPSAPVDRAAASHSVASRRETRRRSRPPQPAGRG